MAALPYMQLYVGDYLADTLHLTTEEHGAYLLLMFNYWQTSKPLRINRLPSIAGLSNERWTDVERTLKEFFRVTDGVWIHPRIEKDLEKVAIKSGKSSVAGKASAAARAVVKQQLERLNEAAQKEIDLTDVQRNFNGRSTIEEKEKEKEKERSKELGQNMKKPKAPKVVPGELGIQSLLELGVTDQHAEDWLTVRKSKKAKLTKTALDILVREAGKANITVDHAVEVAAGRNWQSFTAEYYKPNGGFNGQANTGTNRESRPSLVEQVRRKGEENERLRQAAEQPPFDLGDFDGEFERIDETDGSLVAADDWDVRP